MFVNRSFTVGEKAALTPEEEKERQEAWARTFPNTCPRCVELGWAQVPMRNKACPDCGHFFCDEHLAEHRDASPQVQT
jgi:hypothetical protein